MTVEYSGINREFIRTWRNTHVRQFREEAASFSLETHRIPDPYQYILDQDGDLFSLAAKRKIRDVVRVGSYIGQVELNALDRISQLTRQNKSGVIVWISPPHPEAYPDLKIVVSEIQERGSQRLILNRAIIFDFDSETALKFAKALSGRSIEKPSFENNEQVRARPFMLDISDAHWTDILQDLVGQSEIWEMIRSGEDVKAKNIALKQAEELYSYLYPTVGHEQASAKAQALIGAMIGSYDPSCPTLLKQSALQTVLRSSLVSRFTAGGKIDIDNVPAWRKDPSHPMYCIHCGACGEEIKVVVLEGEQCPAKNSCSAVRECA